MTVTCAPCQQAIIHPTGPCEPRDHPKGWGGHEIRGKYGYLCPICRGSTAAGHWELPKETIRGLEERGLIPTARRSISESAPFILVCVRSVDRHSSIHPIVLGPRLDALDWQGLGADATLSSRSCSPRLRSASHPWDAATQCRHLWISPGKWLHCSRKCGAA